MSTVRRQRSGQELRAQLPESYPSLPSSLSALPLAVSVTSELQNYSELLRKTTRERQYSLCFLQYAWLQTHSGNHTSKRGRTQGKVEVLLEPPTSSRIPCEWVIARPYSSLRNVWVSEVHKGGRVRRDCLTQEKIPHETLQAVGHQSLELHWGRVHVSLLNLYVHNYMNICLCINT